MMTIFGVTGLWKSYMRAERNSWNPSCLYGLPNICMYEYGYVAYFRISQCSIWPDAMDDTSNSRDCHGNIYEFYEKWILCHLFAVIKYLSFDEINNHNKQVIPPDNPNIKGKLGFLSFWIGELIIVSVSSHK